MPYVLPIFQIFKTIQFFVSMKSGLKFLLFYTKQSILSLMYFTESQIIRAAINLSIFPLLLNLHESSRYGRQYSDR